MRVTSTLSYACLVTLFCSFIAGKSYSQACVTGNVSGSIWSTPLSNPINNTTIAGLRLTDGVTACISLTGSSHVTIINCVIGPSADVGIYLKDCQDITITNCSFMSNQGGIHVVGGSGIKVIGNQFTNVRGGNHRGQFVQFEGVTGAGNEIRDNVGENVQKADRSPEDLINMYRSSGTAASPILISGNRFRGGGPSGSGGGIMSGDNGGDYQTVRDNILVDPGQYGIAIAGGSNNILLNNKVYGRQQHFTNIGLYVSKMPGATTCGVSTVQGNEINYTDSLGRRTVAWLDGTSCGPIGDINNNYNATFGPEILPDRLLCPLLMAYYKFNGNWADVSGSGLNGVATNGAFGGQGENLMCANFDGTTRYITLPSSPWLQAQSERLTVSCWIKPWTLTGVQGIAQAQNSDGWSSGWRMVLNNAAANMHLVTDAGTVDIYCGGITQGNWAHVVMVYDGKMLKGYVNGVLQSSAAITGNVTYGQPNTPAKIGNCNGTNYLNAFVDEFKYYDGNLSDAEVLADYNAHNQAVNTPQAEKRLYYRYNNNWVDDTGNGFTAATHGVGFVCDGANSASASFNGSGYLTLPSSTLLTPYSSTMTVAAWIKPANVSGIKGLAQSQNGDGVSNGWRMLLLDGTFNPAVVTNVGAVNVYCGGIQAGVWNYVAMTYDGQALKAYVNGVLQASTPWGGYIVYNNSMPRQMEIGFCNGNNYYFNGRMDEFSFFDGAMSASQLLQEYNTYAPLINATPNCPSSVQPVIASAEATSFERSAVHTLTVRPNPATDLVTVIGATGGMLQVAMYNGLGQVVRTASDGSGKVELRVSDLSAGVYVLRIDEGAGVVTRKVVIQR